MNFHFHSVSGAIASDIALDPERSVDETRPTDVVIHVGTNDIARMGSEVVANNVFRLAEQIKEQPCVRKVFICSVIPRTDHGSFIFSRSESVNNRLHSLCLKSNVTFIDLRRQLDRSPFNGLARDAVHYNKAGAVQVLRLIEQAIGGFLG